jgi:hypothetical protein
MLLLFDSREHGQSMDNNYVVLYHQEAGAKRKVGVVTSITTVGRSCSATTCAAKRTRLLPVGSQFLAPDLSLVQTPKASLKRRVSAVPQAQLVEVTSGDLVKPRKSISKKEVKRTCCIIPEYCAGTNCVWSF